MTYWVTLWYAGAVVFSIGGDGVSLDECKTLTNSMMVDIIASYQDEETVAELKGTLFETNEFSVSCESEYREPDKKYAK